jgi:uracil-DNA glycosylase family 4
MDVHDSLSRLAREIAACRKCPRLVEHRESVAATPPRRYRGQAYWARPLAGFGDPAARVLLVGLAPAANGGNRTGRIFTGDESGNWLFEALHHAGFANQPTSVSRDDGLTLTHAWITAAGRCAPPANKPTREELAACQPFLLRELQLLTDVRVVVALGRIGWENYLKARRALAWAPPRTRPRFGHGVMTTFEDGVTLLSSYHPSQQNTFTGKLTRPMLRRIFETARALADAAPAAGGPARRATRPGRPAGAGARRP